jgi:hypothetical protein
MGCGARIFVSASHVRLEECRDAPPGKLLTAVWALLHHGECFDEERFARD